jgi:hypothetical protein
MVIKAIVKKGKPQIVVVALYLEENGLTGGFLIETEKCLGNHYVKGR